MSNQTTPHRSPTTTDMNDHDDHDRSNHQHHQCDVRMEIVETFVINNESNNDNGNMDTENDVDELLSSPSSSQEESSAMVSEKASERQSVISNTDISTQSSSTTTTTTTSHIALDDDELHQAKLHAHRLSSILPTDDFQHQSMEAGKFPQQEGTTPPTTRHNTTKGATSTTVGTTTGGRNTTTLVIPPPPTAELLRNRHLSITVPGAVAINGINHTNGVDSNDDRTTRDNNSNDQVNAHSGISEQSNYRPDNDLVVTVSDARLVVENSGSTAEDVEATTSAVVAPPTPIVVSNPNDHDAADDNDLLPRARPWIPKKRLSMYDSLKKRTQTWKGCLTLTVSIIVPIAFVLLLLDIMPHNSSTTAATNSTTTVGKDTGMGDVSTATTALVGVPFDMELPEETINAIQNNPSSPQAKANEWMKRDPHWKLYSKSRQWQRYALATLYYATGGGGEGNDGDVGGSQWNGYAESWLTYNTNECEWKMDKEVSRFCAGYDKYSGSSIVSTSINDSASTTSCPDGDSIIRQIFLSSNNLRGNIPPEVFTMLPYLEILDMSYNLLTGTIPTATIAGIGNLKHLCLSHNRLTGNIPKEVGHFNKLETLVLDSNQFSGVIPTEISSLTSLQHMLLYQNKLKGQLPTEIGHLHSSLLTLNLDDNRFGSIDGGGSEGGNKVGGTIPTEIGLLTNLQEFSIQSNEMKGTIPTELSKLSSSLIDLDIHKNAFTGTIPVELESLTNLENVRLDDIPKLSGEIPSTWCNRYFVTNEMESLIFDCGDCDGTDEDCKMQCCAEFSH